MIAAMSSLVLRQVRVVPLGGPAAPDPVDVLIEDGFITELGPAGGAHHVPTVEGEGRWLIPGLWDAHVHLAQWALAGRRLDLSQTSSPRKCSGKSRGRHGTGQPGRGPSSGRATGRAPGPVR